MPTKQIVKLTRSKGKRSRMFLSFDFSDEEAGRIGRAVGLCLKEILTPEESTQFLEEFEAQCVQFMEPKCSA